MWRLCDEVLSLILSRIHDRKSISLVCKQWLRVEGLLRTSLRLLRPDSIPSLLPRFPNLLHFHCSAPLADDHLYLLAQFCPNLITLHLAFQPSLNNHHRLTHGFSSRAVRYLASRCRALSAVSLRERCCFGDAVVAALCASATHHLRRLDLGGCTGVTDKALEAIGRVGSLDALSLRGCSMVTDRGLGFLASGLSKSLKSLNLCECGGITDVGVFLLRGLSCLEELSLARCGRTVTDNGCLTLIVAVKSLRKLDLSHLVNVSDVTVDAIVQHGPSLVEVNMKHCGRVTMAGMVAFTFHGYLKTIIWF